MFEVKQLIEQYRKDVTIKEKEKYTLVTPPFFHIENDESIALKFSQAEDGSPVISDCGTTMDCLEIKGVDINKYRERLNAVKARFFIEEEDGVFRMAIPTNDLQHAEVYVGYFIQAISIIANIDL